MMGFPRLSKLPVAPGRGGAAAGPLLAEARLEVRGMGSTKLIKKRGRNAAKFNDRVTFRILEQGAAR